MSDQLRRLLKSHEFYSRAIRDYANVLGHDHLEGLKVERDRVFDELVGYASHHPQVTIAQLKFLFRSLEDLAGDKKLAERLREACITTAERLTNPVSSDAAAATTKVSISDPGPILSHLTDRAGLCDADGRYLYANEANAAFHRRTPADFAGRRVASVIGRHRYDELTKPAIEACFEGRSISFPVGYRSRNGVVVFSISADPMRDRSGAVVAMICIARDITGQGETALSKIYSPPPGSVLRHS